jgi:uncharacterized membrane protein
LPEIESLSCSNALFRRIILSEKSCNFSGSCFRGSQVIRDLLLRLTDVMVPVIDLLALIFIVLGTAEAFVVSITLTIVRREDDSHAIRALWLRYSRWLIGGLTFQLAADIIETSATPNWQDIGRIGAIAVIRTFLNYFLERDQHDVRELQNRIKAGGAIQSKIVSD